MEGIYFAFDMALHRFEQVRDVPDVETFRQALVDFAHELDFPLFSCILRTPGPRGTTISAISNAPEAFYSVSVDPEAAKRDPVLQQIQRQSAPLFYDQNFYVQAGAADMWDEQAPHGYRTGLIVSVQLSSTRRWMLGVDREAPLPSDPRKLERLVADLQLMATYAQEPAARLMPPPKLPAGRLHLLPRQTEVLRLAMQGKSAWVTGALLGISENTVNYHFKQAFKVLGVSSKNQAVLKALELGLL